MERLVQGLEKQQADTLKWVTTVVIVSTCDHVYVRSCLRAVMCAYGRFYVWSCVRMVMSTRGHVCVWSCVRVVMCACGPVYAWSRLRMVMSTCGQVYVMHSQRSLYLLRAFLFRQVCTAVSACSLLKRSRRAHTWVSMHLLCHFASSFELLQAGSLAMGAV